MLRAVLSMDECNRVLAPKSVTYVGDQFPTLAGDPVCSHDFAVLSVAANETNPNWRPGYYRSDLDLTELNEALRHLER